MLQYTNVVEWNMSKPSKCKLVNDQKTFNKTFKKKKKKKKAFGYQVSCSHGGAEILIEHQKRRKFGCCNN